MYLWKQVLPPRTTGCPLRRLRPSNNWLDPSDNWLFPRTTAPLERLTDPSDNLLFPQTTDWPLRQLTDSSDNLLLPQTTDWHLPQLAAPSDNLLLPRSTAPLEQLTAPSDNWLKPLKQLWQHMGEVPPVPILPLSMKRSYRQSYIADPSRIFHDAVTSEIQVILRKEENIYEYRRLRYLKHVSQWHEIVLTCISCLFTEKLETELTGVCCVWNVQCLHICTTQIAE
jgi:hypothetical protein